MSKPEHWAVTVSADGVSLVTIESACLSGKAELSDADEDVIRTAARHLLAFIGDPAPPEREPEPEHDDKCPDCDDAGFVGAEPCLNCNKLFDLGI